MATRLSRQISVAGSSSVKRKASDVNSLRESTDGAVKIELQEEDEEGNSLAELFVDASQSASRKERHKACKLCDAKPGDATPLKLDSRTQQGWGNATPWGVGSVFWILR